MELEVENFAYYKHFLLKFNKYRSDHQKPIIWLDYDTLYEFSFHKQKYFDYYAGVTHSHKFMFYTIKTDDDYAQHESLLTQDFNHISLYLNPNSNILNIIFIRKEFAVDSIRKIQNEIHFVIIKLLNDYDLWGLKLFTKNNAIHVYGPNLIKKHNRQLSVKTRDGIAVELYAVVDKQIIYGKPTYYYGVPQYCIKVSQIKIKTFESLLDQVVTYQNEKKMNMMHNPFNKKKSDLNISNPFQKIQFTKIEPIFFQRKPLLFDKNKFEPIIQPLQELNKKKQAMPIMHDSKNFQINSEQHQQSLSNFQIFVTNKPEIKNNMQYNKQLHSNENAQPNIILEKPLFNNFPIIQQQYNNWITNANHNNINIPNKQITTLKVAIDNSVALNKSTKIISNQSKPKQKHKDYFPLQILSNKGELKKRIKEVMVDYFSKNLIQTIDNSKKNINNSQQLIYLVNKYNRFACNKYLLNKYSALIAKTFNEKGSIDFTEIQIADFKSDVVKFCLDSIINCNKIQFFMNGCTFEFIEQILSFYDYLEINEICLLKQKVLLHSLIPQLDHRLWVKYFTFIFQKKESNYAFKLIYKIFIIYFQRYSKDIIRQFEDQLILAFKELPIKIVYRLIGSALEYPQDINHTMDLLSILTTCDFAYNIIEVVEKISRLFQNKKFKKRVYKIKEETERSNQCILYENYEFEDLIEIFQKVQQKKSSSIGKQIDSSDIIFQFKCKKLNTKSKKWVIFSNYFEFANRYWRLVIQYNSGEIFLFIQEKGIIKREKYQIYYTTCFINFDLMIDSINTEANFFYSFANNQDETIGCKMINNYDYEDFHIEVKVSMIKYIIHSCSLHHLNLRWKDILKLTVSQQNQNTENMVYSRRASLDMGRRKSCIILEQNLINQTETLSFQSMFNAPQKIKQNPLHLGMYDLNEFNLYYIFNSNNLEIQNEAILLLFLCKYYIYKQKEPQINPLPLLSLRFQYINLKCLLSVSLYHPTLKQNQYYCDLLTNQLKFRLANNTKRKMHPRKNISIVKEQVDVIKELIEWIKLNHFENFKYKFRELLANQNPNVQLHKNDDPKNKHKKKILQQNTTTLNKKMVVEEQKGERQCIIF